MYCYRTVIARLLFSVVLLAPFSFVIAAGLAPPQQVIQTISDNLEQSLKSDRERLASDPQYVYQLTNEILMPHVDFNRVCRLVLGKHWRKATKEQREAFSLQFKQLLVRTYATAVHRLDSWVINYKPLKMDPKSLKVTVQTEVSRDGGPGASVVYRMARGASGWQVYDVTVEGISLITTYRSSFSRLVRKQGMEGLIERIAKLNDTHGQASSRG